MGLVLQTLTFSTTLHEFPALTTRGWRSSLLWRSCGSLRPRVRRPSVLLKMSVPHKPRNHVLCTNDLLHPAKAAAPGKGNATIAMPYLQLEAHSERVRTPAIGQAHSNLVNQSHCALRRCHQQTLLPTRHETAHQTLYERTRTTRNRSYRISSRLPATTMTRPDKDPRIAWHGIRSTRRGGV